MAGQLSSNSQGGTHIIQRYDFNAHTSEDELQKSA
jgi:hypothetical protein